jgi:hypothetical protein
VRKRASVYMRTENPGISVISERGEKATERVSLFLFSEIRISKDSS